MQLVTFEAAAAASFQISRFLQNVRNIEMLCDLSRPIAYSTVKGQLTASHIHQTDQSAVLVLHYIQGGPKNGTVFFVYLITSPNINRFSKFFYCQNQETICNKTITIDPTTPKVCRYTTL